ncbi:MAG: glycosyltransferase family 39 protein, partial [Candidatus Hodarchaeales archaeon]
MEQPKHQKNHNRYWSWVVILIVILSAAAIRIHLLEVPLERDEGEYAYAGQLMLEGIPPYDQVYNMKMPGIYAAYAVIMAVFGQTHSGIHSGLLIINLGRRLFDTVTGITAAAAFALFSLGQPVQGIFANAEHFVLLPALGGILLLVYEQESKNLFILLTGGLLLGLGFLMKQHGAAFIAFAGLYVLITELRRKPLEWKPFFLRLSVFSFSVLLPFVITCIILWQAGVFEKFRFWTFDYAREYVSAVPLSAGISNLKRN